MSKRKRLSQGVRAASGRKLRVESLETRRLLAAESCVASHDWDQIDTASSVVSQSVQDGAESYRAADAAGSSFSTAANLGVVEGTIRVGGRLSRFDRVDMVRFDVTAGSNVSIQLDQLSSDADLYVMNDDGKLIASSTRSGRRTESLSGTLSSGTYYLGIVAGSFRSMTYRLTLGVEPIATRPLVPPVDTSEPAQPTVETPDAPQAEPEPRAPEAESPASPVDVQPLREVDYFGGSRDWNLNQVAAPEAWAAGYSGQGVTVAVIDTGVDLDHPDLAGSLYVNAGEIPGNGIDDDGNGYVDDISGYDFVSGDPRPDDGNGHGTHVAGTIAANRDGVGATGVAPDARILPVRVLDDNGSGSDWSVAAGIRYAADMGAQIINLSLGGSASSRIAAAIEYAVSLGTLVIAAAGNESASVPSYPARYSASSGSVLSVGAFDSRDRTAGFSNKVGGSGAVQVDAPGAGVYSTYLGGGYATLSGTSMASPHVAGVAALTLSANPDLTSSELRELLVSGTVGQAGGSDSVGKVSTLNSVAFAAAGLTTAGTATAGSIARTDATTSRVQATGEGRPSSVASIERSERLQVTTRKLDFDRPPQQIGRSSKVASFGSFDADLVDRVLVGSLNDHDQEDAGGLLDDPDLAATVASKLVA